METTVVLQKMESLQRCIERISRKMQVSEESFLEDFDTQDIVILNLERAVQLCVDITGICLSEKNIQIPSTMRQVFEAASGNQILGKDLSERMMNAVGFRNLAVHQYQKLDMAFVHKITLTAVVDLKEFLISIRSYLQNFHDK